MNQATTWDDDLKEKVSLFKGSLCDIKEQKTLIPTTRNVKMKIAEVKVLNKEKNGEQKNWKQIIVKLVLVDGVDINGVQKYAGAIVSSEPMCYWANLDSGKYDVNKPFFAKGQFLLGLVGLARATGFNVELIKGGISDDSAEEFATFITDKIVLGNIMQRKVQEKNADGVYVETEVLENIVKNFKAVPDSMLV